jgi:hypothetical protein
MGAHTSGCGAGASGLPLGAFGRKLTVGGDRFDHWDRAADVELRAMWRQMCDRTLGAMCLVGWTCASGHPEFQCSEGAMVLFRLTPI